MARAEEAAALILPEAAMVSAAATSRRTVRALPEWRHSRAAVSNTHTAAMSSTTDLIWRVTRPRPTCTMTITGSDTIRVEIGPTLERALEQFVARAPVLPAAQREVILDLLRAWVKARVGLGKNSFGPGERRRLNKLLRNAGLPPVG